MDFTLGETQQAVSQLAAQVLTDADPWKELARAGLLDVSPPDGLGVLEVAVLLTEIGKRAPSMKALATLMTGALPLARWGRTSAALLPARRLGRAPPHRRPPRALPPGAAPTSHSSHRRHDHRPQNRRPLRRRSPTSSSSPPASRPPIP